MRALIFVLFMFPQIILAQNNFTVSVPSASLLDSPRSNGKVLGTVPQGKKIFVQGEDQNGYYKIQTKSGRAMYVHFSELSGGNAGSAEDDLMGASEETPKRKSKKSEDSSGSKWDGIHITYDLSASTGSYYGKTYTEAQLGVNLFFLSWLAWRNGVFARFVDPENVYGLDTSLRAQFDFGLGSVLGATIFGGPGYRFVTKGDNVPMVEGGLNIHLAGFSVGGGVKTLYYKAINQNRDNDTQYFLTLSGGRSLL